MEGNFVMGPSHDIHYIHTLLTCRKKQVRDLPLWGGRKTKIPLPTKNII